MALNVGTVPFDRAALQECTARARPADAARGMYFNAALKVVQQVGGAEADKACRKAVGTARYIDIFKYPVAEFLRIMQVLADRLSPGGQAVEDAYRLVGIEAAEVFLGSATGKTLLLVTGRNLRGAISSVPAAYAAMVTFGQRSVTWLGERQARVSFQDDLLAGCYHAEILERGLTAILGAPVGVTYQQPDPSQSVCEIAW